MRDTGECWITLGRNEHDVTRDILRTYRFKGLNEITRTRTQGRNDDEHSAQLTGGTHDDYRRWMPIVPRLQSRGVYLWVVFVIPAVAVFGHALAPNTAFVKGQDLGVLGTAFATVIAAGLWIVFRPRMRWSSFVLVFLSILGAAWVYQVVSTQLDQSLFTLSAFVVPVILVMVALKAVENKDIDTALLALAYSLIVISLLSLILGSVGLMPDGFEAGDAGAQRVQILQDFGVSTRWGGPFGSVNYASPIGGLLVVVGLAQRRWHRIAITCGGVLILVLGGGRSALVAVLVGVLVLVLASKRVAESPRAGWIRVLGVTAAVALVVAYIVWVDPTLNGRTTIWSNFWTLVTIDPVLGVGESGINAYVQQMVGTPGFVPHTHAHGVLFDAFARYGVVMALLTVAIYCAALWTGARGLRQGKSLPAALAVFVVVAGATETIHSWNYWSVYVAILTWVALSTSKRSLVIPRSETQHEPSVS